MYFTVKSRIKNQKIHQIIYLYARLISAEESCSAVLLPLAEILSKARNKELI